MSSALSGIKIAVVGGDDREIVLISELIKLGATITTAGFPREIRYGGYVATSVEEACRDAEVLILPMPGTDANGLIRAVYSETRLELTEKVIKLLAPNALIIIGVARPFLREWAKKQHFTLLEVAEMDEVAILNSIPTAEGAIQIAMEELPITIHGSHAGVLGFGRVGFTLGRMLKALGAEVTVVSRELDELSRAFEIGCHRVGFEQLEKVMSSMDVVFNTVPAMILTREVLKLANPELLIVDLAAQPGGTDFEAAQSYGIRAILAPGLPGKVAPLTAGRILSDVLPRLIIKEFSRIEQDLRYG